MVGNRAPDYYPKPNRQNPRRGRTALEEPSYPFEHLSDIAELESWPKGISRPVDHAHKGRAQRLGSVFRAIIRAAFYARRRPSKRVVFDPFMGSGTTVGEAIKLGFRAAGQDINPVSHFLVNNALAAHSRPGSVREFEAMEADTAPAGGAAPLFSCYRPCGEFVKYSCQDRRRSPISK